MKYTPSSEQVVSKLVDGEVIVINLTTGIYYSLESTAAKVWRDLCSGCDREALIADAMRAYPESTKAASELEAYVEELTSIGLLAQVDTLAPNIEALDELAWPPIYSSPEHMSFDDVAEMVALDPPLPELQSYASDS